MSRQFATNVTTIYDIFCPVPFLPSPFGFRLPETPSLKTPLSVPTTRGVRWVSRSAGSQFFFQITDFLTKKTQLANYCEVPCKNQEKFTEELLQARSFLGSGDHWNFTQKASGAQAILGASQGCSAEHGQCVCFSLCWACWTCADLFWGVETLTLSASNRAIWLRLRFAIRIANRKSPAI